MRRIVLFTAATAALLLGGCSNEVVEGVSESNAISFENAFVDKSTRATDPSDPSTTVATLGSFKVYGYQGTNLLFNGQEVSSSDEGTTWSYSPLKYWLSGIQYNFVGVAKAGEATTATALNDGTITTTITGFTSDGTTDLLATAQVATEGSANHAAVGLTFKHLLSKLQFQFTNGFASTDDVTLKVTGVTITDAYETGTVAVVGDATTDNITWAPSDANLTLAFGDAGTLAPQEKAYAEKSLLLIPTSSDKSYNITFTVAIKVNEVSGSVGDGFTAASYAHEVTLSNVAFKPGYTYNLTATLNASNVADNAINPIEFSVTGIEDWTSTNDTTIE